MKWSKTIVDTIERIPFSAAIFLMLLLQKVSPVLHGGEEQYLAYAKQFVNPSWIPNSFSLTEAAGSRLVFQIVVGWLLQFLSFESFVLVARTITFALFAIALGSFFKKLELPKLWTLLLFQLYLMSPQAFFGGEWIFNGFEPKTVAYVFVFFSLSFLQDKKAIPAALLLALGTYFHFLVTGWIVVIIALWWLISGHIKLAMQFAFVFGLAILPFVGYLYFSVLKDSIHIIEGVNVDWYYSYFRLRHHLGIAFSWEYFSTHQLPGILGSIVSASVVFKLKKGNENRLSLLSNFVVYAVVVACFFVIVALIDSFLLHQEATFFLKTYPFRSMALALFFTFLLGGIWADSFLQVKKSKTVLLAILVILFLSRSINNFNSVQQEYIKNKSFYDFAEFVKLNTQKQAVFVCENLSINNQEQFIRKTERESIYVYKYTPAEAFKLYYWVVRKNEIAALKLNKISATSLNEKYNVTHIVSKGKSKVIGLKLIAKIDDYMLYEL